MKFMIIFFALALTQQSFAAGIDTVKNLLEQKEVEELEAKLSEKGYYLSSIVDRYAQNGIRPRCICESFELSFTKYLAGGPQTDKYSVMTTGFGSNFKVTIQKVK